MANAWCINAIWFDWTLIQTLQQLDSSNIWVWVQFTAPDPLDDKRLDYIKYTDKNWNTCCLTWENEILIYATNWTIKNLTLTNDDANEVVNVKRSDVFWSNRKKTVVRYKTWWYPTSITDWTLAVEELVQNQYSSSWFNVEWLEDWTTYYFSAFAVAQDDTIIVMQTNSITTDFAFAWYQRVEYIESTWTQYIDSWYKPNYNTKIYVKFAHNEHVLDTPIFWARTSNSANAFILWSHPSNYSWWTWLSQTLFNDTKKENISWYAQWTQIEFQYDKSWWYYWNTTRSRSPWSWTPNVNLVIFWLRQWTSVDNRKFSWKMRKFTIRESNSLVRDLYPVYRKSDNVVWLFDKQNKVFYTNAWTWSFTKWPNV